MDKNLNNNINSSAFPPRKGKAENINIYNNPNPEQEQIPSVAGTVENSNDIILSNMGSYLQYIRDNINHIIKTEGLLYSEPMDTKKLYPAFTYTQFLYLLSRVHDEVFEVNTELLYKDYYNHFSKKYDTKKVELLYEVYYKLCMFYGFNCSPDGFYFLSGLDDETLKEWLSVGRSNIYKKMFENGKKSTIARFENSNVPILNLAAGNYKYKLNAPSEERQDQAAVDVLPDLLAIGQGKKQLTSGLDSV